MSHIVLGAGLSGLSAAYYLLRKLPGSTVALLESSSRTGGWIKSTTQANGVVFEQGPRTIRPKGPAGANTLKLIEELNLTDQLIPITSDHHAAQNRMIYANSSLHMLPSSAFGLFKTQEPFTKPLILHLLNDLKSERKKLNDESIYDFVSRRFSKEIADYLISPLICGICAGNAQEISVKFLMGRLFEYEQTYGSISRGIVRNLLAKPKKSSISSALSLRARQEKWNVYSFVNGCETLPLTLKDYILKQDTKIHLNTTCNKITTEEEQVKLHLNNNEIIAGTHLISAIPATSLVPLVQKQHPNLANHLNASVKNVSVAVVNLQFDKNVLKNEAFGLLVTPKEQLPVLGVIFDSCCFPKKNVGTVLTVMMGGYWFEHYFGKTPDERTLLNTALKQLQNILGINEVPTTFQVNVLRNCLPQYIVGHNEHLAEINKYIKDNKLPISLCGASYDGVGINDVILSAKNAVDELR